MSTRILSLATGIRSVIYDHLFLRYCLIGDHFLDAKDHLVCDQCLQQLPTTIDNNFRPFGWNSSNDGILEDVASYWEFSEGFQKVIHEIKYQRKTKLGEFLGAWSAEKTHPAWIDTIDAIIPIPLHRTKQRARGFNQAEYIARGIAQQYHLPVNSNVLKRVKYTSTQTQLSRDERKQNMENAFEFSTGERLSPNSNVLLVDDVFTTGSTMLSAAITLHKNGIAKVFGFTLASAPLHTV